MEYLGEIISFLVGALAGGITVKFHSVRSTRKNSSQAGNVVGGDMAGRDMSKR